MFLAVDLDGFLERFARCAGTFHWFFVEEYRLRCWIEENVCCPLQALGYARSGRREVPDRRNMASATGLDDRTAAAVVHHADCLASSRYWRPEVRAKLLALCGLGEGEA